MFLPLSPIQKSSVAIRAVGVAAATFTSNQRQASTGTLTGEAIVTLVSSIGKVGTFATATGEGYIAIPSFNMFYSDLGEATGEAIDDNEIGIGSIIPPSVALPSDVITSVPGSGEYQIDKIFLDSTKHIVVRYDTTPET
jgi:hypothetical protein